MHEKSPALQADYTMKPTIDYIQARFDEYNRLYFNGLLPAIPIRLSHAKGFLGKVTFTRKKQGFFGGYKNTDFVLRINVRIDLPEEVIEDTILHEMIHYYIGVNQWQDSSTHGRLFRREMARINAAGNRHITISHRLTDEQRAQAVIRKERLVALVMFEDGKQGIKVVPKQVRHMQVWDKKVRRYFPIRSIEWFLTDDIRFDRYPSSMALRIYLLSPSSPEPTSLLSSAKRLFLDNGSVMVRL